MTADVIDALAGVRPDPLRDRPHAAALFIAANPFVLSLGEPA
ncbi:hypothetical protein [Microtetraspora malaysiensis]|nr:hypothetical protein [Microtetraspora malaysiensis]